MTSLTRWLAVLGMGASVIGCGGSPGSQQGSLNNGQDAGSGTGGAGPPPTPTPDAGTADADGGTGIQACSDLFDDTSPLRSYSFDISPDEWSRLDAEFRDIQSVLLGTPQESYHPITFHLGTETVSAFVRLKGQSSWVSTVMNDANPKMQFAVAFDQADPNAKFHGVGKLEFDMPRSDWTFLNERVANTWLRQAGIMAPCAGSGQLSINGAVYGTYVTEESKGVRLISEFFPTNPHGDLFKGAEQASTNKAAPNWTRLKQFKNATDLASIAKIVDLESSVLDWASEALLNDSDGYYGGSHNFYLYDQGAAGYVFLPTDVDSTLGYLTVFLDVGYKQHPIFWWEKRILPQPPGRTYLLAMNDPGWRAKYVAAIATQLAKWDVAQIQGWLDKWSAQIADAVTADPRKWATVDQFHAAVADTRDMVAKRPAYLQSFVACEQGQKADDADGDGVPWCNDCDDGNAAVHPGAPEICNQVDDNCDGVVDEGCGPAPAPGGPPY